MVVSAEDDINVKLGKLARNSVAEINNRGIGAVVSSREEGIMQNHHAPLAIGVVRNSVFNELNMSRMVVVLYVKVHEKHAAVGVEVIRR